jgi:hypothetical protein
MSAAGTGRPERRRGLRSGRRLAVLGAAAAFTVLLAQHTTTAAFTAQTADSGNQATTAATFCTTPGTTSPGGTTVTRDTAVYEVNPGNNYGTTAIGIGTGASGDAYTLLKFNLPSFSWRCTVTAARLYVYARTPSAPATINAYRASGPWDGTLTWSSVTRPTWAGTPAPTPVSASAGWLSWDVTTLTQELYSVADYGFLLKDSVDHHPTVTRFQTWESLESYPTRAPYLVITWG